MVAGKRLIKFTDEMKCHLSSFTGMDKPKLEEYFQNSKIDTFLVEFEEFVQPKDKKELFWYYRACRSQFVHNAKHSPWPILKKWVKKNQMVLDYGAGVGQNCFEVFRLGAFPTYFDISILQRVYLHEERNQN
jgi:hypothetical protein